MRQGCIHPAVFKDIPSLFKMCDRLYIKPSQINRAGISHHSNYVVIMMTNSILRPRLTGNIPEFADNLNPE